MSNAEDSKPLLSLPRNGELDDDDNVDPSPQPVAQLGCVNLGVNEIEDEVKQFPPQANDDVFGVITVTKQPHVRPQHLPQFRPGDMQAMQKPTDYTWLACASAICCCPLLGIVGVYYGMLSEKQYNDGQHEEARKSSHKALGFTIAAVIMGILIVIISIPVNIVILTQRNSRHY